MSLSLYIYICIGKRLEVPQNAIEVELEKDLEMSFLTAFYSVLLSSWNMITH
jgi:hypothetical protein